MNIFITNNITTATSVTFDATVEAEFGSTTILGSVVTLAHHGENSGQPCPCIGDNISGVKSVLVSHFDLDTLGGIMRLMGRKDMEDGESVFWKLAAAIDVQGPHKIRSIYYDLLFEAVPNYMTVGDTYYFDSEWDYAIESVQAFWAWSEKNRLFATNELVEVTEFFAEAVRILELILVGEYDCPETQALLEAGRIWAAAKAQLESDSFLDMNHGVILRSAAAFTNHLYEHNKEVARAIVGFNDKFKSITISLESPISGFSVEKFVQELWGPEAGGRDVIGGSPRGRTMTMADAYEAFERLVYRDLK